MITEAACVLSGESGDSRSQIQAGPVKSNA